MSSRYSSLEESERARVRRYQVSVNGSDFSSTRKAFNILDIKCKTYSHISFRANAIAGSNGSWEPFKAAYVDEEGKSFIFTFKRIR